MRSSGGILLGIGILLLLGIRPGLGKEDSVTGPIAVRIGARTLSLSSALERRLFEEYGALFASVGTVPPGVLFRNSQEVEAFQSSLDVRTTSWGPQQMTLQSKAMDRLLEAAEEIRAQGGRLTPHSANAAKRTYSETQRLWDRNVGNGLDHWRTLGKISKDQVTLIRGLKGEAQVSAVLDLEETQGLFFSTAFDKSILRSVAAPGTSQHLSLLAFDVSEYLDDRVKEALAQHGWYRTVVGDLPHFTYLGWDESQLPSIGLKKVEGRFEGHDFSFWVPDMAGILVAEQP